MGRTKPKVLLIEDDRGMRASLSMILRSEDIDVVAFETPSKFLSEFDPDTPGCVVMDLKLPEMSGLELVSCIRSEGGEQPFIVITGLGDIPDAVEAMKLGAVDFIQKPFGRDVIVDRVREALEIDAAYRTRRRRQLAIQTRLDALTPREREVLDLVVAGKLTKQIASKLKISTKTVDVHRSNISRKLEVESVAQLVRVVSTHLNQPFQKSHLHASTRRQHDSRQIKRPRQ